MRNESDAHGADDSEMRELLDIVTAERLLDGAGDAPPALARVLAQAAAEGRASELTGEAAALAAFRTAGMTPAHAPARSAPARSPRRRRWLIAVAAAAFTFASAGVAVAAATGILPNPLRPANSASPTLTENAPRTDSPGNGGNGSGPSAPPPDEAVPGLCRAYLAQAAAGHGDELHNPRFEALATLAGGADKVFAYCTARASGPSPEPTHGRSDDHPGGPPTITSEPHANKTKSPAK